MELRKALYKAALHSLLCSKLVMPSSSKHHTKSHDNEEIYTFAHTRFKYEEMKNAHERKRKRKSQTIHVPTFMMPALPGFSFIVYLNNNP